MNNHHIKVSAIIPAYNCVNTLERAVDSILQQSYLPSEIIIVNNNSTDKTLELAESFALKNPTLIKVLYENQQGSNFARNTGLKNATGDWIQLLDADDELLPDKINQQIEIITIHPDADVIYSGAIRYILNKEKKEYEYLQKIAPEKDIILGLINSTLGRTHANLWKLEPLKKVNYFDTNKTSNQEYFLLLELYKINAKFIMDHDYNSIIYMTEESVSRTTDPNKAFNISQNKIEYCISVSFF